MSDGCVVEIFAKQFIAKEQSSTKPTDLFEYTRVRTKVNRASVPSSGTRKCRHKTFDGQPIYLVISKYFIYFIATFSFIGAVFFFHF